MGKRNPSICTVDGCDWTESLIRGLWRKAVRGMCPLHYQRWRKTGALELDITPLAERFWAKVGPPEGERPICRGIRLEFQCRAWLACRLPFGYGRFLEGKHVRTAHGVAFRLTYPNWQGPLNPGDLVYRHLCNHPWCCEPTHVQPGSRDDNSKDAVAEGRVASGDRTGARLYPERRARGERHGSRTHPERVARGDRHPNTKLTDSDIRTIRERRASGERLLPIAKDFGIAFQTVSEIAHGYRRKGVV